MAVIKDIRCAKCGYVSEAMLDGEQTGCVAPCRRCHEETLHASVCNGGVRGARYRFMDWDGFDPTGHVEYLGVKAGNPRPEDIDTPDESKNATPWQDLKSGKVYHEASRYQKEAIAERRAKRKAKNRRKNGLQPLFFDGGKQ